MPSKEITVSNKLGIHARPAAQFVKMASEFKAEIRVEKDGEEVDGKSIMGLIGYQRKSSKWYHISWLLHWLLGLV